MTGFDPASAAMHAAAATAATVATPATNTANAVAAGGSSAVPFADVLQEMATQTAALDQQASAAVGGVMDGSGVEIHDAMIAVQKSNMAFELALQVRNKAVGAYQQMLSMQF